MRCQVVRRPRSNSLTRPTASTAGPSYARLHAATSSVHLGRHAGVEAGQHRGDHDRAGHREEQRDRAEVDDHARDRQAERRQADAAEHHQAHDPAAERLVGPRLQPGDDPHVDEADAEADEQDGRDGEPQARGIADQRQANAQPGCDEQHHQAQPRHVAQRAGQQCASQRAHAEHRQHQPEFGRAPAEALLGEVGEAHRHRPGEGEVEGGRSAGRWPARQGRARRRTGPDPMLASTPSRGPSSPGCGAARGRPARRADRRWPPRTRRHRWRRPARC